MTRQNHDNEAGAAASLEVLELHHQRVRDLLAELREATEVSTVATLIGELHPFLMRHFAEEEAPNGLYDQIGIQGEEHLPSVQSLVAEHERLLGAVHSLMNRTKRAGDGAVSDILTQARQVAETLASHERRERELMHQVLGEQAP